MLCYDDITKLVFTFAHKEREKRKKKKEEKEEEKGKNRLVKTEKSLPQ